MMSRATDNTKFAATSSSMFGFTRSSANSVWMASKLPPLLAAICNAVIPSYQCIASSAAVRTITVVQSSNVPCALAHLDSTHCSKAAVAAHQWSERLLQSATLFVRPTTHKRDHTNQSLSYSTNRIDHIDVCSWILQQYLYHFMMTTIACNMKSCVSTLRKHSEQGERRSKSVAQTSYWKLT